MSQQKDLLNQVLADFDYLVQNHGFSQPSVSKEDWMTRVDYLHENIAVELELDWRDFDVFTLIVRLEDGELPNGYYVSNGQKCRKHLANICTEQRWPKPSSDSSQSGKRTEDDFKRAIGASKKLVAERLQDLLAKGESLFV